MATVAEQVQQIYIGLLGRAAESNGLDYWVDQVTTGALTLDQVRANFVSSQDEYITNIGSLPREEAVNALYQNLFARDAEAEGLAYWTTGAGQDIAVDELVFALINGAALTDAGALENRVEVAQYYTDATANGLAYDDDAAAAVIANVTADDQTVDEGKAVVDGGTADGEAILLTTSQDNLEGTAGADTFNAFIFDNNNTAQSGDLIDGGAGTDTLFADIGNSQNFAITLSTESVEKFQVRAQVADNNDTTDNNLVQDVQIDAERMEGTNWYESNNSRADVIIEDVRIERQDEYGDDTDQITRDITIAMVSTDPGNVDLGVYFDQHSLVKQGDAVSNSITLNVANQLEVDLGYDEATPLLDIPYDQVSFVVNGTTVTLNIDLADVETYDDFYVKLQDAFANEKQVNPALLDVNLTRTLLTEDFIAKDGENRLADEYILTSENGTIEPATVGWNASAGLPSNNAFSASVLQGDVSTTSNLITSTIYLDDVGRGSMGGDLVVGGLSIGDTSSSKGVEQFDITVERSSQLQEIQSTNNTLEEVYLTNGAVKGDLVVAGSTNATNSAQDVPGVEGDAGFTDVRVVDGSAFEGSLTIDAELTSAVVDKYLDNKDFATDSKADDVNFLYKLGSNDDTLDLEISNANLDAAGTSTRDDFILNIDGNAGDDKITTIIGTTGAGTDADNWYINSKLNANLSIDAGTGNDTVTTTGAGDFVINAGSGNDTVYANNDGSQTTVVAAAPAVVGVNEVQTVTFTAPTPTVGETVTLLGSTFSFVTGTETAADIAAFFDANISDATVTSATATGADLEITFNTEVDEADVTVAGTAIVSGGVTQSTSEDTTGVTAVPAVTASSFTNDEATWVVNAANTELTDLEGEGATTSFIGYKASLTVTLSGAGAAGASGLINAAAVDGTTGFESTVTLGTIDYLATEAQVNQAIKDAINNDAVLSKLLVATDGPAHSLVITSLVDGEFNADDLDIGITGLTATEYNALSTSEKDGLETAYQNQQSDSTVSLADTDLGTFATAFEGSITGVASSVLATNNTADLTGAASTSVSDNTITLGTGDDVAVLGTDETSNDTLVFSGTFGNDSIFNFTEEAAGGAGDFLDFNAYLGGIESASDSVESQTVITNTVSNGGVNTGDVTADEIVVINDFVSEAGELTTTENWDNLTAADLFDAIEGTDNAADTYGDSTGLLDDGTLNVNNTSANLVGDIIKNVVLIENDANQGEYKVFEVTSSNDDSEFTAVTLVGTIDLGASLVATTADAFVV